MPAYWDLRQRLINLRFRARRRAFATRSGVFDLRTKNAIFAELLAGVAVKIVWAVLVVAALAWLEYAYPIIAKVPLRNDAEYGLLGTLAQVSATMLGLYFAAVSLVASTAYARVSGDVRQMVVEEQVGNFYFGFLAQFAATSVVMLSALSLGVPIGLLNIVWVSFLALFGVFSFVVLGLRTFSFFDPTAIVEHLNRRLARAMAEVTPDGYKWQDSSFQDHHRQQAERILEIYSSLAALAEQGEDLNNRALTGLAEGLLTALNQHAWVKSRIPSKSYWFRRRPQHKPWLTSSYHEVEIARVTDTALQPEMVPDHQWFEEDAARILTRIVTRLASRTDLGGLVTVLNLAQKHAHIASARGAPVEPLFMAQTIGRELDRAFANAKFDGSSEQALARSLSRLAAIDLQGLMVVNLLLGSRRLIESAAITDFTEQIERVRWSNPATLYPGRLPREVIVKIEEMQEWFDFERRVERRLLTPRWLHVEVAALGYAKFLAEVLPKIVSEIEARFGDLAEQRIKASDHIGAASIINRGLEATNKLDAHLLQFRAWWDDLVALNRSRDWEWPTVDWPALERRSQVLHDRLVKQLATCIVPLARLPEEKLVPDLFGQAYSVLADGCFDALIREDEPLFRTLFPVFFMTALEAHIRLRGAIAKVDMRNIAATLGPLSDLLSISGFAELYAALANKPFNTIARTVWDKHLAGLADDAERKRHLGMFTLTKEPMLGMSPRDMLRFRWERATRQHLAGRGIVLEDYGRHRRRVTHPNPLVRAFAATSMMNDGEDIFLVLYVFARPEMKGIEMPASADSLRHHLEWETEAKEEADGAE